MKEKIVSVIAVIALLVSIIAVIPQFRQTAVEYGAAGGMLIENYLPYVLYNGGINTAKDVNVTGTTTVEQLTTGGTVTSSSTTATVGTLSQAEVSAGTYLFTPNTSAVTLTLPLASSLTSFVPNSGDQATLYFRNATTSPTIAVTFAGNTGTILENASSTSITAVVGGGKGARLLFARSGTSTDVYVTLQATQ